MKANNSFAKSKLVKKTVLLTGATGVIGSELYVKLQKLCKVYGTYHESKIQVIDEERFVTLNITDFDQVSKLVKKIRPDIIIHAAAVANFKECFEYPDNAYKVNAEGTKNIAIASEEVKARLIYLSTDLVYDGEKGYYTEDDAPCPKSTYGKTKLYGEKAVFEYSTNYIIARLAMIYAFNKKCFANTMLYCLLNNKKINLFSDEYRCPIHLDNLVDILIELAAKDNMQGVYHVCGNERLSRYELGELVAEYFKLNEDLLVSTLSESIDSQEKRPKDCSMINDKLKNSLLTKVMNIKDCFALYNIRSKMLL